MTRGEAQDLLRAQNWTHNDGAQSYHLYRQERNNIVKQLKEAFTLLGMGYDGDFCGIKNKESDKFCNINVHNGQFVRGGIDIRDLKVAPSAPEKVE